MFINIHFLVIAGDFEDGLHSFAKWCMNVENSTKKIPFITNIKYRLYIPLTEFMLISKEKKDEVEVSVSLPK